MKYLNRWHWAAATLIAAGLLTQASAGQARERITRENPKANYDVHNGFLYLGYGVDPIPQKTVSQRWHAWRRARFSAPSTPRYIHEQVDTPTSQPVERRTSSWREF